MYSSLLWYQGQVEQHILFIHSFISEIMRKALSENIKKKCIKIHKKKRTIYLSWWQVPLPSSVTSPNWVLLEVLKSYFLPSATRFYTMTCGHLLALGLPHCSGHRNSLPCCAGSSPAEISLATDPSQPRLMKKVSYQLGTHSYHYTPFFFHVLSNYCADVPISEETCTWDGRHWISGLLWRDESTPEEAAQTLAKTFAPQEILSRSDMGETY